MLGYQILRDMEYSEPERIDIEDAFMTLARSGVLLRAMEAAQQRFTNKFTEESVDVIAREIEIYRSECRPIKALHDFGVQLMQERKVK